jgi:hypothetical protein
VQATGSARVTPVGGGTELSLAYPDHEVKGKKAMLDEWIGFDFSHSNHQKSFWDPLQHK